jgi:hypothetical protein
VKLDEHMRIYVNAQEENVPETGVIAMSSSDTLTGFVLVVRGGKSHGGFWKGLATTPLQTGSGRYARHASNSHAAPTREKQRLQPSSGLAGGVCTVHGVVTSCTRRLRRVPWRLTFSAELLKEFADLGCGLGNQRRNAEAVVHRIAQVLLAPEITLRRLHRGVAE